MTVLLQAAESRKARQRKLKLSMRPSRPLRAERRANLAEAQLMMEEISKISGLM